ncbi:ATP-binding protein [Actinomadura craniellae]|nr:ATP-binding protein [Actinomadura craniellae]
MPLRVRLAPAAASVGIARDRVRRHLEAAGCPHLVEDAVLIVSELVTNAARASRPDRPIELRARLDGGRLLIEVEDSSPGVPRTRRLTADSLSGRGLHIVTALATECGHTPTPHGKVVWALLG